MDWGTSIRNSGHRSVSHGGWSSAETYEWRCRSAVTLEKGLHVCNDEERNKADNGRQCQRESLDPGLCGAGVMGAGSVIRHGAKNVHSRHELMPVAAGETAAVVLAGGEATAAKGKLQLVPLRVKKKRVLESQNLQEPSEPLSRRSCLDRLKKSLFLLLLSF